MWHNILITSVGKRVALTKYFKDALNKFFPTAKVFTTDMNPRMSPAGYVSDRCFSVPHVSDRSYPDLLLEICRLENIGIIIPTIDTELLLFSELKERFLKEGISIIVSSQPFVSLCRDKRNTSAFF